MFVNKYLPYSYVSFGTRRIVCAQNSQMASSLSQIVVLFSNMTITSFPLEIEKNIRAMKISSFLQYSGESEIEEILDGFQLEANSSHLPLYLGLEHGKSKFTNFKS